jgi:putative efflux protein, MATE family
MNVILSKIFNAEHILKKHEKLGTLPSSAQLLKNTVKMAWPSILEGALMALVGFIDLWMVSVLGDDVIAGVGLTSQPKLFCIAVFTALAPAVSAIVARRKGEEDRDSAIRVVKIALVAGSVIMIVISVLSVTFSNQLMLFAGSEPATHGHAVEYFNIIMGGMLFNVLTMIINAAQRGVGNTKISLTTNLTSNIVNIIFNYILINGKLGFPVLGVRGAAIATVMGSAVAFVMALLSVMHVDGYIYLRRRVKNIFEKRSVKALCSMGSSAFVEQIALRGGFLIYAIIVANLGKTAFAAHNIGIQFMAVSFAFGDGIAAAAIALVGFSLGQRRSDIARVYGAFCQRIGLMFSISLSLIFTVFGRALFSLFSDTDQVLKDGETIMAFLSVILIVQIIQLIYIGCLRGSGDVKYTALVSLVGIGVIRPVLAFVLCSVLNYGVVGAWAGLIVDQLVRAVMVAVRFHRGRWTKIDI